MSKLLMPKATAVWLIENTTLTFKQIGEFTEIHELEIQAIADSEVQGMFGVDPTTQGQLSWEEIERCQKDPQAKITIAENQYESLIKRKKVTRYQPIAKRNDKPNGIAWILKNEPSFKDSEICRLIGTTKSTIEAIRTRRHWNSQNIEAKHPLELGLCKRKDFEKVIEKAKKRNEKLAQQNEKLAQQSDAQ